MAAINNLPMITLIYPSDLIRFDRNLFHANVFQFEYQDFEVQFELQENDTSGLAYNIHFFYPSHSIQIHQRFHIGTEGYSNLLLKAMVAKRLPFDLTKNIIQGRLTRVDIIQDHGVEKELLFHAQCAVYLFQIMDQILFTHKTTYSEYCARIEQEERERSEESFTWWFLIRACRFLKKSGLEYHEKELNMNEEVDQMSQLWEFKDIKNSH
jgi:hypothetical protein